MRVSLMSPSRNFTGFRLLLVLLIICPVLLRAQKDSVVTVVPGPEYEAGWLHKVFFGDHWRDLWTTPISVPVLNLKKFEGGLTPLRIGGGEQTKSLRFKSRSGREYKFRSINKDPSKALPPELRETLASELVKDQTSSANPMAPLIVAPLLKELGILQAEPLLFVMPDSPLLGEYRKEFSGLLGTIEIHPDEYDDESENFAGAEKVSGTDKLIERLKKDNDEFVKPSEYLKARLTDIFLGDWDRHIDQWRWARFSENGIKYWYPIPRDRDQAFARFDGLFPFISAMAVTQLEHFSEDYPDVEGITWSGRHTDRRFLHPLTKTEWDSVTRFVQMKLTDPVISNAVGKLPPEMFENHGEEIIRILKVRRDKLKEISDDYYYEIIKYVNVTLSDKDEFVEIKRLNKEVDVKVYDLDKNKIIKNNPYYHRIFSNDETKEIRLILNGGDDKVLVTGEADESIKIYAAGGQGKDTLIDKSLVNGFLCAEKKTIFMDSGDKTVFIEGRSTAVKKEKYAFSDEIEAPRDWGHDWKFAPWFNINPDDGLFFGGGAILYEFGFRRRPYVYRMELTGGYATHAKRFRLRYRGEFNPSTPGIRYLVEAKTSGLEVINFFGYGNNTLLDQKLRDNDYYKVKQQQIYIAPAVEVFLNAQSTLRFGTQLLYADTDEGELLFQLNPYGSKNMLQLNLNASYTYDSRTNKDFPVGGIYFLTAGGVFPPLKKDQSPFYKLKSEAKLFFSSPSIRLSSIALRAGGEKVWGNYPFFEAAFLGGETSLRGFERNRFAGDASVYTSVELRFFLTDFKMFVPIYTGLTALGDAGKVFYNGDPSGKIRTSYGGGVWVSFVKPEYLLSLYVARSVEDTGFYLSLGFHY
jgi:hypothetical protein